jgi:arsenate reductase
MTTVLFACVTQRRPITDAAAFFNAFADPSAARAISAGTEPAEHMHTEVVECMREEGIDLSGVKPALLTDRLAATVQFLITMGCGETCPVVAGVRRIDWSIADPKGQPPARVRAIRDEIRDRVRALIASEGWQRQSLRQQNGGRLSN